MAKVVCAISPLVLRCPVSCHHSQIGPFFGARLHVAPEHFYADLADIHLRRRVGGLGRRRSGVAGFGFGRWRDDDRREQLLFERFESQRWKLNWCVNLTPSILPLNLLSCYICELVYFLHYMYLKFEKIGLYCVLQRNIPIAPRGSLSSLA